jgi:xylulokinase
LQVAALDVGTTRIKASIVDPHGKILKSVTGPTAEIRHPSQGQMEVDAEEVYANASTLLKELSKDLGGDDLIVSLSCMAPVLVVMGKSLKPLRPAILYNDLRTSQEVDELNTRIGLSRLLKINGNRANVQQYAPKILWLRKHEPSLAANAHRFWDLASYIVWRLSGEEVIDYSVAEEGGLLDYSRKQWSEELLSFMELDHSKLPVLKPTSYYGEITGKEKSNLGLGRRAWVTVGCVDAIATPLTLGLLGEGRLSIELGTTGIIYTASRMPKPDDRLYLDFSPIEGLYYIGGGTAASGICYNWMIQLLMNGRIDYDAANRLASTSSPGSKGVVILPYILGERTPVFDMLARAIIFGLTLDTKPADILHGTLEGIAYSLRHNMSVMLENGYLFEAGSISGGGARDNLFRRIVCDVLNVPLSYNFRASTTVGAAYIGYMAAGLKKRWEEIQEWLTPEERITPDPSLKQMYDRLFSIYVNLYEKHKDDFKTITES